LTKSVTDPAPQYSITSCQKENTRNSFFFSGERERETRSTTNIPNRVENLVRILLEKWNYPELIVFAGWTLFNKGAEIGGDVAVV